MQEKVGRTFNEYCCRYTDCEWRERKEDKSLEGLLTLARRERTTGGGVWTGIFFVLLTSLAGDGAHHDHQQPDTNPG